MSFLFKEHCFLSEADYFCFRLTVTYRGPVKMANVSVMLGGWFVVVFWDLIFLPELFVNQASIS
jgi:hypothetical protein